ncbi:MAG: Hsp33 family molecular chaperone HslO [Xanthomonadaceae bacterium]|nr:Hsp33 family molecular chaperone HslO [Xanthomonadaceae bacterium]MDE2084519.1 Hsp33 family molecular chaperone HslO [Xanthomonadaceae bacterium]MDE2256713.1 Hsp33 family molecular chaperone HslO [Xanthomonadaceae bacterium]
MSDFTHDFLHRFELERAGVRGVFVRLAESWRHVRERADYPPVLADLLGRTLAASALFTGNIKFDGALSIQIKQAGPVGLLFAECGSDGRLRGLARWQGDIAESSGLFHAQPAPLLAITIDNRESNQRYQGLVPVEDAQLAILFERYFERSEQLPTRVMLACGDGRCAGLMLQRIPGHVHADDDADAWNRVGHLLASASERELLTVAPEILLYRLFHEESVRLHAAKPLVFGCSCSRERVAAMLHSLGRAEAEAAVREDGVAEVTCEFCNTQYRFDRVDLEQVFRSGQDVPVAPTQH